MADRKPFALDDRVLIVGSHPWRGHTGTITEAFRSRSAPDLRWVVSLDDGWSTAAVADRHLRPADQAETDD